MYYSILRTYPCIYQVGVVLRKELDLGSLITCRLKQNIHLTITFQERFCG